MPNGYLKVYARADEEATPIPGALVLVKDKEGAVLYDVYTDETGATPPLALSAPDASLTLDPDYLKPAYSNYDVTVTKNGYVSKLYHDVEIVADETAVLNANMNALPEDVPSQYEDIYITPVLASESTPPQTQQTGTDYPPGYSPRTRVLPRVVLPEYITVHLGAPNNTAVANVRVKFIDYIKNVVSSEIYPTWPENAIIANIHAIVTFTINRIYTEWYRSRGYNFDITNSTAYDHA
jgi:hypothetical protein